MPTAARHQHCRQARPEPAASAAALQATADFLAKEFKQTCTVSMVKCAEVRYRRKSALSEVTLMKQAVRELLDRNPVVLSGGAPRKHQTYRAFMSGKSLTDVLAVVKKFKPRVQTELRRRAAAKVRQRRVQIQRKYAELLQQRGRAKAEAYAAKARAVEVAQAAKKAAKQAEQAAWRMQLQGSSSDNNNGNKKAKKEREVGLTDRTLRSHLKVYLGFERCYPFKTADGNGHEVWICLHDIGGDQDCQGAPAAARPGAASVAAAAAAAAHVPTKRKASAGAFAVAKQQRFAGVVSGLPGPQSRRSALALAPSESPLQQHRQQLDQYLQQYDTQRQTHPQHQQQPVSQQRLQPLDMFEPVLAVPSHTRVMVSPRDAVRSSRPAAAPTATSTSGGDHDDDDDDMTSIAGLGRCRTLEALTDDLSKAMQQQQAEQQQLLSPQQQRQQSTQSHPAQLAQGRPTLRQERLPTRAAHSGGAVAAAALPPFAGQCPMWGARAVPGGSLSGVFTTDPFGASSRPAPSPVMPVLLARAGWTVAGAARPGRAVAAATASPVALAAVPVAPRAQTGSATTSSAASSASALGASAAAFPMLPTTTVNSLGMDSLGSSLPNANNSVGDVLVDGPGAGGGACVGGAGDLTSLGSMLRTSPSI